MTMTDKALRGMIVTSEAYEMLYWTLNQNWNHYHACISQCCKAPKAKPVHELRTTLRRLVATLDLVKELQLPQNPCKLRKQLKRELGFLRNLRDLQSQEETLNQQLKSYELEAFRCVLKSKRKQEQRNVERFLKKIHLKKQGSTVQALCKDLLSQPKNPLLEKRAKHHFECLLSEHFQELKNRVHQADATMPSSLHQIRIEFKKFRYTWDAVAVLYPIPSEKETKLKQFQRLLGEIQDSVVLIQLLREFLLLKMETHPNPEYLLFLRSTERKQEESISVFFSERDEFLRTIEPGFFQNHPQAA